MKFVLIAIGMLGLTACVHVPPESYEPREAPAAQDRQARDVEECEYEAQKAVRGLGLVRGPMLVDRCMALRGYGKK